MTQITAEWIVEAINIINSGIANKLEKEGITVYKCGTIIRIDVKS